MSVLLNRVKFLIVDDNAHAINLVKAMLRGFGTDKLDDAQTIEQAKQRMKANPADIIILDYMMGEEEGVTFARWLRTDPESPNQFVPIILLTGHADMARIMKARDAGVNEFCIKPVTPADLMKRINAVINQPRAFVQSGAYFGPDRRRRDDPKYSGPERRADRKPKR